MYPFTFAKPGTDAWPLSALGARKREFITNAEPLLHSLNRPDVSVAFGGHFNSGKSTLLAALIGRDILPIGDVPETGVACRIRTGAKDQVRRIAQSGEAAGIPFDRSTIAGVIAAYTHLGERRLLQDMPAYLEIEVADAGIPPGATWIDSPGINDSPEMSDRAFEIAVDTDLLVWVLNSRQCLSDPEIQFLGRYVAERGTEALALVLNVFLDQDNEMAWAAFAKRELPALVQRVRGHADEFGASADEIKIHVVSARAMQTMPSDDFGGVALKNWLSAITDPSIPLIRKSRVRRVDIACDSYVRSLEPSIERARLSASRSQLAASVYQTTMARRETFRTEARSVVSEAFSRFAQKAEAAANSLCDAMVSGKLDRGSAYQDALNRALTNANLPEELCDRLAILYERHSLGVPSTDARDALKREIAPRSINVRVADADGIGTVMSSGAIAGAVLASVLTGGASLVAAGIGAAVAAAFAKPKDASDLLETKASVRAAMASEIRRLRSQEIAVLTIVNDLWLGFPPPTPAQFDLQELVELEALREAYVLLRRQFESAHR